MKVVVVGTGTIARQHIGTLKELSGVDVVGVCDLSQAKAEATAERFGIPKWYTDYREMVDQLSPDVAHITTPVSSHYKIARDILNMGVSVFIEKPITPRLEELLQLKALAEEKKLFLMEDHNYRFNAPTRKILNLIRSSAFGDVVHVEINMSLDISKSRFAVMDATHPDISLPGGVIFDFLPHMAYLSCIFTGAHIKVRTIWDKRDKSSPFTHDEFRALVKSQKATATLCFSANSQPDAFWLRVYGTKMRAIVNLFESRLTIEALRPGPKPLMYLLNGFKEAKDVFICAISSIWSKLGNRPAAYEGLWELIRRTYKALEAGKELPVSAEQIVDANRLLADLVKEDSQI